MTTKNYHIYNERYSGSPTRIRTRNKRFVAARDVHFTTGLYSWRSRLESNQRIAGLQSAAFPFGYWTFISKLRVPRKPDSVLKSDIRLGWHVTVQLFACYPNLKRSGPLLRFLFAVAPHAYLAVSPWVYMVRDGYDTNHPNQGHGSLTPPKRILSRLPIPGSSLFATLTSRWKAVSLHAALWCPDFPLFPCGTERQKPELSKSGEDGWIRTSTVQALNLLPLPVGVRLR